MKKILTFGLYFSSPADLNSNNSSLRDEVAQLRGTISALDREKDNLQMAIDEKTERVVELERELNDRGRSLGDHRTTIDTLEARLE